MREKLVNWLDTFLVIDVFLVIIAFAWFAIAVIGRYSGVSLGLDLWHRLWEPVFTPAIGILMGGAILSGIIKQVTKRFNL
ncbi:MAG: hypothetical protein O4861_10170 [Trichodesmium sp. St16_bin4-tuft]|uniref:Uncharacterized protein n=1 Tax=Trichodesmium erythraeum (strain IMS101) TaxID=203124 RepID=Q118H9_TRIEI|nr:hypothetical protein [Trichodesmium erythraeum GBRTRLIN201]MCH2049591.1 hypothetical protein [Trichodesmium sp. ALOHA_ZT_67]MCL2929331.1 hypothetical protein [Trichodesmium sp. MAG_R01]MDE5069345.1 hypothetical protein [Trichodesmium sp. St4_bin8_1]MDE5071720.1 hypothetical protein [Trichodesmium sp. St5_bin8]MDE5078394.1 hypothetical protein [Trichodesmium sp. St2_bin6]MDE5090788.1 hypothetical protein [Trichodesmium sp. St18_bin3_1_1]MDE5095169.1 hypothetical protein [Trichodesmium sp. 